MMVGWILGDQHHPCDGRDPVGVYLQGGVPKILRVMLLADEETGIPRLGIDRKRQREADRHPFSVRLPASALEPQQLETAKARGAEVVSVLCCIAALERQH